jgi:hypothetical protein
MSLSTVCSLTFASISHPILTGTNLTITYTESEGERGRCIELHLPNLNLLEKLKCAHATLHLEGPPPVSSHFLLLTLILTLCDFLEMGS